MKKKTIMSAVATVAFAVASVGGIATPAAAHTACDATAILINSTKGGEKPSWRSGHAHLTGKHYVGGISRSKIWYWHADNDNGSTDKPDTYYGMRQC